MTASGLAVLAVGLAGLHGLAVLAVCLARLHGLAMLTGTTTHGAAGLAGSAARLAQSLAGLAVGLAGLAGSLAGLATSHRGGVGGGSVRGHEGIKETTHHVVAAAGGAAGLTGCTTGVGHLYIQCFENKRIRA
jgi:hypothetical protein